MLRVERSGKRIQQMSDTIELNTTRINTLPLTFCDEYHHHWPRANELDEYLGTATKKWTLLAEQKRNYTNIIHLAEKNPDLGVDVMGMKKRLIECQGQMEEVESVIQCLRERIYNINVAAAKKQHENNNRLLNNRGK
ncbi:MAG: hypothetical protein ABSH16_08875 [Sedimentisphaerales bacterium]